ncbi:MAG: GNAT family N-acetyltransferase [Clostridia bacterium]|nr:GNAT family N-acetyltransferase [Clostridia bacterium]
MTYSLLTSLNDSDIPQLLSNHLLPEVSLFIDINEKKYFKYVTKTENVFYYKISENGKLIGSVHCEISGTVLYVSLLIFPEFQNNGFGTKVIKDIISGTLPLNFDSIEVSIDKTNLPSLRLFEKVGFIKTSVDGGLVNYTYIK